MSESLPVGQAQDAAASAATRSKVVLSTEAQMGPLRAVAALLTSVWGESPEGAPLPPDVLRAISHAGCNVTVAREGSGRLVGTAVAIVSPDSPSAYSLIAAVAPDANDRGIGFALKQYQRYWALQRGLVSMIWTFDPLVSRNARFNLTKLGAHGAEYARDFYGEMTDAINAGPSDRLVAVWPLTSDHVIACSEGSPSTVDGPDLTESDSAEAGPDGEPFVVRDRGERWCRVPPDIVALRTRDPQQALSWRTRVGAVLESAFEAGYRATGVSRSGWYRLEADHPQHNEHSEQRERAKH